MGAREFAEWQVILANEELHPVAQRVRHAQLLMAQCGKQGQTLADYMRPDSWLAAQQDEPAANQPTFEQLAAQVAFLNTRV